MHLSSVLVEFVQVSSVFSESEKTGSITAKLVQIGDLLKQKLASVSFM